MRSKQRIKTIKINIIIIKLLILKIRVKTKKKKNDFYIINIFKYTIKMNKLSKYNNIKKKI